jgi:hypothetical protein
MDRKSFEITESVTKFLAIDCEMDQMRPDAVGYGVNIPCKVTIVNERG